MKKLILVLLVVGFFGCEKSEFQETYFKGNCRIESSIAIYYTHHDSLTTESYADAVSNCLENNGKWIHQTDSTGNYYK